MNDLNEELKKRQNEINSLANSFIYLNIIIKQYLSNLTKLLYQVYIEFNVWL